MKVYRPDDSSPERLTVSELAERARTSIPSIKFYVREGILRPGDLSANHRAFYDDTHVRRLRLIHVLRQVGGLGMPSIRDVCKLLDAKGSRRIDTIIAHVIDSLGRRGGRRSVPTEPEAARAHREVLRLLEAREIRVRREASAVADLANALVGLRHVIGPNVSADDFVPYLDAMCALAKQDFESNRHLVTDPASAGVAATFATVLWEPVLILLRRIAHEHVATETFRAPQRVRKRTRE
jgi:DNA-binding transcriptional MerR regulator